MFCGPKQCKARNAIQIGASAEITKKMTPFFVKRCFFDMVEKMGFTNCVFEKLCFPENIIYSVFSKTQLFKMQNCMLKKTENL